MSDEYFITTKDNPFDYFVQFDEWLNYDRAMGYYTLELIGRTVHTSIELSEEDQQKDFDLAIEKILKWHGDFYKKIYKSKSNDLKSESKESK